MRLAVLILLMFSQLPANAHHAFAAAFEKDKRGVAEGVITEVFFKNPHIQYYLSVAEENGNKKVWEATSMSPTVLRKKGWTKKSFKVGDTVTVEGFLGRDNKPKLWIKHIKKPDGTAFHMENNPENESEIEEYSA